MQIGETRIPIAQKTERRQVGICTMTPYRIPRLGMVFCSFSCVEICYSTESNSNKQLGLAKESSTTCRTKNNNLHLLHKK